MPRKKRDGSPMFAPQRPALVVDRVRYVGDPVAMVIAETLAQAKDAAELVVVDYEPLPSVTSVAEAAEPDAPRVWDENPDNISHTVERGNQAATDAAFAQAAHIVGGATSSRASTRSTWSRAARSAPTITAEDRYTLYADVNYPHRVRNMLANMVFKVPESSVRVVCHDVGGGFGAKGWQYVEHRLTLWAARKLDRPVKWRCERSEVILADEHGRDNVGEIELALDENGKVPRPAAAHAGQHRRLYRLRPAVADAVRADRHADRRVRHPGRLRDDRRGAVEHQPDRALSRRRPAGGDLSDRAHRSRPRRANSASIRSSCAGATSSSRSEDAVSRRRSARSTIAASSPRTWKSRWRRRDYAGFAARREASRARGKLRGIALVNAIEQAAGPVPEYAEVRFQPSGSAMLLMGTKTHGQGHETSFKQILHEKLGIDPQRSAVHRRRHRPRRVRHGLERLALDGDRRHGADARGGEGDREGQEDRRASAGGGGGRHRVRRRQVQRRRHRSQRDAEAGGDARRSSRRGCRKGMEPGFYRARHLRAEARHLPERLPCLRGRGRSRHRRGRAAVAIWWSTTSAR